MRRIDLAEKVRELGMGSQSLAPDIFNFVIANEGNSSLIDEESLKTSIKNFIHHLREKYKKHARTWSRLLDLESTWLSKDFLFAKNSEPSDTLAGPGRPRKNWDEIGARTKCRRVTELECKEFEALALATVKSAKQSDQDDLAFVLKESIGSPVAAEKARKGMNTKEII